MAINVDKSVYQAPMGLDQDPQNPETPALSIEIENPESVTLDDGSMEITIIPGKEDNDEFNANLAENMDEGQLTELSGDLLGEYDADINSRKDWLTTYVDGLELLGLKVEERTEPIEEMEVIKIIIRKKYFMLMDSKDRFQ